MFTLNIAIPWFTLNLTMSWGMVWLLIGLTALVFLIPVAIGMVNSYQDKKKKKLVDEGLKKIREKEKNS